MLGQGRFFKIVILFCSVISLIFTFQNCDSPFRKLSSGKSVNKPANNGQGYTGKVFINIAIDGSCGTSGSARSTIEKVSGRYYQTVKDCKEQIPVDVTANVDVQSYNFNLLIFSSTLFEIVDQNQSMYSSVACRGQGLIAVDGQNQRPFADVSMQPTGRVEGPTGNPVYKGYVKTGSYDSAGNLIVRHEYEIATAVEILNEGPNRMFLILDSTDPRPRGAGASSLNIPRARPEVGSFQFVPPGHSQALVVDPMFCYYH